MRVKCHMRGMQCFSEQKAGRETIIDGLPLDGESVTPGIPTNNLA